MLGRLVQYRTSALDILSCQNMFKIRPGKNSTTVPPKAGRLASQQDATDGSRVDVVEYSLLPGISSVCLAVIHQCSHCSGNTVIVYWLIFVFSDSSGFVHTKVMGRARVEAACQIFWSIYVSNESLSVVAEPRYVNW